MSIPSVIDLLEQIKTIHSKKNADYSSGSPFENFERAAELISWFDSQYDKAFVNHIATKLARLSTLLNKQFMDLNSKPNNESIDDSFLDLCTYCILWAASKKRD